MEAYFIDNDTYISCENDECIEKLRGIKSLPDWTELIIKGDSKSFQAWARDKNSLEAVYKWDSRSSGGIGSKIDHEWPES